MSSHSYAVTLKVTLRKDILDPAGRAVESSLMALELPAENVRIGKLITFNITAKSAAAAQEIVKKMADRLLVNAVMEDYCVDIKKI